MAIGDPPRFDPYLVWQCHPLMTEVKPIPIPGEPVQDGMLTYYKAIAPLQDSQIEARISREPFFLLKLLKANDPPL